MTFAHLFLNIFKEIWFLHQQNFASLKSRRTNSPAYTKRDSKLFQGRAENLNITYGAFSHDVMSDMLVSWNSEMAAMLVPQTNPVGVAPFYAKTLFDSMNF